MHGLVRARRAMEYAGLGHVWLPGCSAWSRYVVVSDATMRRWRREGLVGGSGLPQITRDGYLRGLED